MSVVRGRSGDVTLDELYSQEGRRRDNLPGGLSDALLLIWASQVAASRVCLPPPPPRGAAPCLLALDPSGRMHRAVRVADSGI